VAAAATGTGHGIWNIDWTHNAIPPDWACWYVNVFILPLTTTLTTEFCKGKDTTYILLSQGSRYVWVNTCDLALRLNITIRNIVSIIFCI
jgi:hypothetical protein